MKFKGNFPVDIAPMGQRRALMFGKPSYDVSQVNTVPNVAPPVPGVVRGSKTHIQIFTTWALT